MLIFTDQSVRWWASRRPTVQVMHGILDSVVKHLKAKGIDKYKAGDREVIVDELVWRATAVENLVSATRTRKD